MRRAAVRAGPFQVPTEKRTFPGPLPLAGDNVTQSAVLAAVQAHPAPVRTVSISDPPDALSVEVNGSTEYLQPRDCLTVTSRPAMVTLPVRSGPFVASTVKETVPFPLPESPAATVIHGTSVAAVQRHCVLAVLTWTVRCPPVSSRDSPVDDKRN